MIHIADVVNLCLRQRGDVYIYGVEVSPSNPDPAAFDCSELIEWSCARNHVDPTMPDGSWAQYNHCKTHKLVIPVDQAIRTYGALLFRGTGTSNPASEHVAMSLGDGNTIEARGRAYGVNVFGATGRSWHAAGMIPGCIYDGSKYPIPVKELPLEDDEMLVRMTTTNQGQAVTNGLQKRWLRDEVNDLGGLRNMGLMATDQLFGVHPETWESIPWVPNGEPNHPPAT